MNLNYLLSPQTLMIGKSKFEIKRPHFEVSRLAQVGHQDYLYLPATNHEDTLSVRLLKFSDGQSEITATLPTLNYENRSRTINAGGHIVDWTEREGYSFVSTYSTKAYACAASMAINCRDCISNGALSVEQAWALAIPPSTVTCGASFSDEKSDWLALTQDFNSNTDEKTLLRWMIRFSKPGGFSPDKHLGILVGILQNPELAKRYGELTSQVMLNVLSTSGNLHSALSTKYRRVLKDLPAAKLACANEVDKKILTRNLFTRLKRELLSPVKLPLNKFEHVQQYAKLLDNKQKEDLAESIGDSTAAYSVSYDQRFQNIFFSKIFQFCYQSARHYLGLKTVPVTDLTIVEGTNGHAAITATILANQPIQLIDSGYKPTVRPPGEDDEDDEDDQRIAQALRGQGRRDTGRSDGGFYFAGSIPLNLDTVGAAEKIQYINWQTGKSKFSGRVTIKPIVNGTNYFVQEAAFRYEEMLKDRELRTVVIAGANLEDAQDTIKEYDAYYKKQGFSFSEPQTITDTKAYLAQKVHGDKPMDFFIKEAHSDGDEKNLFRVNKHSSVRYVTRKTGDVTEVVEIITPISSGGSELIENQTFGEWVRLRESKGIGPLAYLNSSCWSHNKARAEAAAAHSPVLLEIATLTLASTFVNSEENALRIIVHAIRERKTFAQIREALMIVPGFKARNDDVYIFPDEPDYTKMIVDRSIYKYDFKIEVFEESAGTWIPYHLDQRIQQGAQ